MPDAASILAIRSLGQGKDGAWCFQSSELPGLLSAEADVAFGGATLAQAIHAAYQTIEPAKLSTLRVYSVLGHFYGTTRCSVPLDLKVTALRDTRSFATRQVTVTQPTDDKSTKLRTTSVILVDFVSKAQDRTVVSFSAQPRISSLTHHSELPDIHQRLRLDLESGKIEKAKFAFMAPFFELLDPWHNRYCPEGMLGQQSIGLRLGDKTDQDALPYAERTSYDWVQLQEKPPLASSPSQADKESGFLLPPTTSAASACLFAYFLDTWTSGIAPWWAHVDLADAQAYATLDFALRFHVDELDFGDWHLREHTVPSAGDERDYVQANLWREAPPTGKDAQKGELKMAATMTQTCVLRGRAGKTKPATKL